MGVPVDSAQPKDAAIALANKSNAKCEPSDESEYSSLEDDDDIQGKCSKRWHFYLHSHGVLIIAGDDDSEDDNSLTESEDNFHLDQKLSPIVMNGLLSADKVAQQTAWADCVRGRCPKNAPLTPSLFAHVPPYITFATHEEKGAPMPSAVTKILKWKLTTITPIVIRKVLLNSGFRLLKRKLFNAWLSNVPGITSIFLLQKHRDKRLDGRLGQTHEKSMLSHTAFIPKNESYSGHVSARSQRSHLAQFANTNVSPWQKRVQLYAAHIHFAARSEAIQTPLAALRAEKHQMDHQAASICPWHRHQSRE